MTWEEAGDEREEEGKLKDSLSGNLMQVSTPPAPEKTQTPGRVNTAASQRRKRTRRG